MSSARWISAWSASGWMRGDLVPRMLRSRSDALLSRGHVRYARHGSRLCGAALELHRVRDKNYFSRNLPEAICGRPVTGQL